SQHEICLIGTCVLRHIEGSQYAIVSWVDIIHPLAPVLDASVNGMPPVGLNHIVGKLPGGGVEDLQQSIHAIGEAAQVGEWKPVAKSIRAGNANLLAQLA